MTQNSLPAATLTRCCTVICDAAATHTVTWDDGDYAHLCFDCAWDAYHGTVNGQDHGSSMTTGIVGDAI